MYVLNRTRGTYLGVNIKLANSFLSRMLGLYRYHQLHFGDGVWLIPCRSIQTIGMRCAIDVIFVDDAADVVRVFENVQPGQVIWPVHRARSVLEVPVGVVQSSETQVGDHLEFVEDLDHADRQHSRGAGRRVTRIDRWRKPAKMELRPMLGDEGVDNRS